VLRVGGGLSSPQMVNLGMGSWGGHATSQITGTVDVGHLAIDGSFQHVTLQRVHVANDAYFGFSYRPSGSFNVTDTLTVGGTLLMYGTAINLTSTASVGNLTLVAGDKALFGGQVAVAELLHVASSSNVVVGSLTAGTVHLDKGAGLNTTAATVGSLTLESGSMLKTSAPVTVDRELTLAPSFKSLCPGDAAFVEAGDGVTKHGDCPWASYEPAALCTIQMHTCGAANATDHSAAWLLDYVSGVKGGAPPRCFVGHAAKSIFTPGSGFDPRQPCA